MRDWFYKLMEGKISFMDLEWRLAHSFSFFGSRVTFIIDGTEQPVATAKNPILDTEFYSNKKKQHSINVLIIIDATTGRILWISPSYPGATNDNVLANLTKHLWVHLLNLIENGFGDSGFNGLRADGIPIETPPSERDELYKLFSSKRIRVENKIAAFKDFQALKLPMRMHITNNKENILAHHNKLWTIVGAILNEYQ